MAQATLGDYPLDDNLKMALLVSEGLPATAALKGVGLALGMRPYHVGPLVNISRKTMGRRLKARARLKPDESERVARLMRLIVLATEVFESEENARAWLGRPLQVLGGQSPLQLSATEPGAREVEQVLRRIEEGVFA